MDENPWSDRFTPLLNREEIRRRVAQRPIPLYGMNGISPTAAGIAIENALSRVFYPSEQCLDILLEWITVASTHSAKVYGSHHAFLEGVYQAEPPLPDFSFPFCLSGLAGTGKSALHKALGRIMPARTTVTAADGTVFPLESHRAITVRASSTPKDILVTLAQREGGVGMLSKTVRKHAYRDGWAFLCLDEFQFATQSDKANTRIVQMLMAMCYIGIPAAFIANFSMVHKLHARNQEDIHRLLSKPRLLHPESRDSEDWRILLYWYRELAPEVFAFDPQGDAGAIHDLTYGVKRALVSLLRIAFVNACASGRQVTTATLERAYKTADYAIFRDEIEALHRLCPGNRNNRKDLWCPISGAPNVGEQQTTWAEERQRRTDLRALQASMTAEERQALMRASKEHETSAAKPRKGKVVSLEKQKSAAEQLHDNFTWFQDKL